MTLKTTLFLHSLIAVFIGFTFSFLAAGLSMMVTMLVVLISFGFSSLLISKARFKELQLNEKVYIKSVIRIIIRLLLILAFPLFHIGNPLLDFAAKGDHTTAGELSRFIVFGHMALLSVDLWYSMFKDVSFLKGRGGLY